MSKLKPKDKPYHMDAAVVYDLANWALLLSLIVGVISTYAIVASGRIKERVANQELAAAQNSAAQANMKAAQLEKEAQIAKFETERIKSQMAWRRISDTQHAKIVSALKGKITEKIWVEFVDSDPEATTYHADITKTLQDSGIETQYFSGWQRSVGIRITNYESETGQLLLEAFKNAGIILEKGGAEGPGKTQKQVEIIIGSKPPQYYTSSQ